jgi:hypothetical protein
MGRGASGERFEAAAMVKVFAVGALKKGFLAWVLPWTWGKYQHAND